MKRWFSILLCLALVFALCACSAVDKIQNVDLPPLPEVTEEPTAPETTDAPAVDNGEAVSTPEPVQPTVDETAANRVVVNFVTTSYERFDPPSGLQRILTFSYVTPKIRIEGRDEAADKINEYIAMLDETYYTGNDYGDGPAWGFNGILEAAEDNYAYAVTMGDRTLPLEYSASRSAKVGRLDDRLINLVFEAYEYTGGAHGSYEGRAYVFDAATGERVRLADLSEDQEAFKEAIVAAMLRLVGTEPEYYQEHIDPSFIENEDYEGAFGQLMRDGSWYFDNDGLVVFSALYELAPYASGLTEFHIPYAELEGMIPEKYLPAEREGAGEFSVIPLEDIENGSVVLLDKITVSEGQELCLMANGTIYDVYLSEVTYADRFYEKDQLWASSFMTDGAIQIVTTVPEGIPNLMISYTTADGQRVGKLLSQSGLDGRYLLIDDQIEVLG